MAGHHTIDVACGFSHTVCITASGNAYSWGSNAYHQLGLGLILSEPADVAEEVGKVKNVAISTKALSELRSRTHCGNLR